MEVKLMTKLNHRSQILLHKWRIRNKEKKKLNPQNNNNNDLVINLLLIIRKVRR